MTGSFKNTRRFFLAAATLLLALGIFPIAASAHVVISPNTAVQGTEGEFAFRVPNEEDVANTTKLEVQFPTDAPIASVSVEPKAGWTYTIVKAKLDKPLKDDDGNEISEVVSTITWQGGVIKPGEFDEFHVSMGPLPKASSVVFKVLQTYDNGDVVSWIEQSQKGADEPEHPAPVLTLKKADADTTTPSSTVTTDDNSDNTSSSTIGYIGIGVGILALILAAGALTKKQ